MEQELFLVGSIARAHGLRGEVEVVAETDFPERFREETDVYLVSRAGLRKKATLRHCRWAGERVLITIAGVRTREEAEALAGWKICVTRDDLVALSPGRYYVFDIVGLKVVTLDGRDVGVISDVWSGPANDVYFAEGPYGEILIPATEEIVREIDMGNRTMRIYPMPGLVEGLDPAPAVGGDAG
jgi:16S rRNA processing protein RimM